MASANSFLKTLKLLDYPVVDVLDEENFNLELAKNDLGAFFEVFCSLNEKNVLTTEEIEEYAALTPAELAEMENLKNLNIKESDTEYEKRKEALFLEEHLSHIENHNKLIERQIEIFKRHEDNLFEEVKIQEDLSLDAMKRFHSYELNEIPKAEEKFVSHLESILEVAEYLKTLTTDTEKIELPTSKVFKGFIEKYFDAERKILQAVNTYLENNFKLQENGALSVVIEENMRRKELIEEASCLQKALQSSILDRAVSEKKIRSIESMEKYFETLEASKLNYNDSLSRYKLDDVLKLNEQLRKKEDELMTFANNCVSKYVDTRIIEFDSSVTNETINKFQFCSEKITLAMKFLLLQRARIEMLIASLKEHKGEFEKIKKYIQNAVDQMITEQACLLERKSSIENEMCDVSQEKNEQDLESVILPSLYKILSFSKDLEAPNISKITLDDSVQKVNEFFKAKENLRRKHEEKLQTVESMEKYVQSLESLLNCTDEECSNWHDLEQKMNVNFNNLDMKLKSLEEGIVECSQELEQKQMLLERKANLRLARNLYVYALMNKELFEKYINDIKVAIDNSTD